MATLNGSDFSLRLNWYGVEGYDDLCGYEPIFLQKFILEVRNSEGDLIFYRDGRTFPVKIQQPTELLGRLRGSPLPLPETWGFDLFPISDGWKLLSRGHFNSFELVGHCHSSQWNDFTDSLEHELQQERVGVSIPYPLS